MNHNVSVPTFRADFRILNFLDENKCAVLIDEDGSVLKLLIIPLSSVSTVCFAC